MKKIKKPKYGKKENLKKLIKKGVDEFNKYKSPEAIASIVDINNEIKIKMSGPFCRSCGFQDYFDDLKIELESSTGLNLDIVGINEVNEESYIVKFALKGGEKL
jgi:predicted Zn-ribbon and HTH transcriptional regulator